MSDFVSRLRELEAEYQGSPDSNMKDFIKKNIMAMLYQKRAAIAEAVEALHELREASYAARLGDFEGAGRAAQARLDAGRALAALDREQP